LTFRGWYIIIWNSH